MISGVSVGKTVFLPVEVTKINLKGFLPGDHSSVWINQKFNDKDAIPENVIYVCLFDTCLVIKEEQFLKSAVENVEPFKKAYERIWDESGKALVAEMKLSRIKKEIRNMPEGEHKQCLLNALIESDIEV